MITERIKQKCCGIKTIYLPSTTLHPSWFIIYSFSFILCLRWSLTDVVLYLQIDSPFGMSKMVNNPRPFSIVLYLKALTKLLYLGCRCNGTLRALHSVAFNALMAFSLISNTFLMPLRIFGCLTAASFWAHFRESNCDPTLLVIP
jgi:hypothetical protein